MEDLETPPQARENTPEPPDATAETGTDGALAEAAPETAPDDPGEAAEPVSMEELMGPGAAVDDSAAAQVSQEDSHLMAVLEAVVYIAEEPLTLAQIAAGLQESPERVRILLEKLVAEFEKPEHGLTVREVAGGYKMATKPEHHDAVRSFVKSLKPPLKLSLPALETLAVIAYKQPVTAPEIMEIRGVQGAGVLKTLLDRKLIVVAGRKNVVGKPILYKTTKEFLIQFGLKDLTELPSLKEFEEIRRMAFADADVPAPAEVPPEPPAAASSEPEAQAPEPPAAAAPESEQEPEPAAGELAPQPQEN